MLRGASSFARARRCSTATTLRSRGPCCCRARDAVDTHNHLIEGAITHTRCWCLVVCVGAWGTGGRAALPRAREFAVATGACVRGRCRLARRSRPTRSKVAAGGHCAGVYALVHARERMRGRQGECRQRRPAGRSAAHVARPGQARLPGLPHLRLWLCGKHLFDCLPMASCRPDGLLAWPMAAVTVSDSPTTGNQCAAANQPRATWQPKCGPALRVDLPDSRIPTLSRWDLVCGPGPTVQHCHLWRGSRGSYSYY